MEVDSDGTTVSDASGREGDAADQPQASVRADAPRITYDELVDARQAALAGLVGFEFEEVDERGRAIRRRRRVREEPAPFDWEVVDSEAASDSDSSGGTSDSGSAASEEGSPEQQEQQQEQGQEEPRPQPITRQEQWLLQNQPWTCECWDHGPGGGEPVRCGHENRYTPWACARCGTLRHDLAAEAAARAAALLQTADASAATARELLARLRHEGGSGAERGLGLRIPRRAFLRELDWQAAQRYERAAAPAPPPEAESAEEGESADSVAWRWRAQAALQALRGAGTGASQPVAMPAEPSSSSSSSRRAVMATDLLTGLLDRVLRMRVAGKVSEGLRMLDRAKAGRGPEADAEGRIACKPRRLPLSPEAVLSLLAGLRDAAEEARLLALPRPKNAARHGPGQKHRRKHAWWLWHSAPGLGQAGYGSPGSPPAACPRSVSEGAFRRWRADGAAPAEPQGRVSTPVRQPFCVALGWEQPAAPSLAATAGDFCHPDAALVLSTALQLGCRQELVEAAAARLQSLRLQQEQAAAAAPAAGGAMEWSNGEGSDSEESDSEESE